MLTFPFFLLLIIVCIFLCPILFQEACKAIDRKTESKIKQTSKSKRKFKFVSNRGKIKQVTGTK